MRRTDLERKHASTSPHECKFVVMLHSASLNNLFHVEWTSLDEFSAQRPDVHDLVECSGRMFHHRGRKPATRYPQPLISNDLTLSSGCLDEVLRHVLKQTAHLNVYRNRCIEIDRFMAIRSTRRHSARGKLDVAVMKHQLQENWIVVDSRSDK